MSQIIEKPFDATQRIDRSVFRGAPNLITDADLNRQIEALKYQSDLLDRRVGAVSDYSAQITYSGGNLSLSCSCSYLEILGCLFTPAAYNFNTPIADGDTVYVCFTGVSTLITYEEDATHKIAGALFEDGTSMAAADQKVFQTNGVFVGTKDISSVSNLLAIMAVYTRKGDSVVEVLNCVKRNESVLMKLGELTKVVNDNYDTDNPVPLWTPCSVSPVPDYGVCNYNPQNPMYRVKNGNLELQFTTGTSSYWLVPDDVDENMKWVDFTFGNLPANLLSLFASGTLIEGDQRYGSVPCGIQEPAGVWGNEKFPTGSASLICMTNYTNGVLKVFFRLVLLNVHRSDMDMGISQWGMTNFKYVKGCPVYIPSVLFSIPL